MNHFCEVDENKETEEKYLIIHTGSRNFGLKIALYHQDIAEKQTLSFMTDEEYNEAIIEIRRTYKGKKIQTEIEKLRKRKSVRKHKRTGLEYLTGEKAQDYFADMEIAQIFAELNRRAIGFSIFDKTPLEMEGYFVESNHNYINFEDGIVRKGATSAHKDEPVIIPLNMELGTLLCKGLGNEDYNYSAPHGLGRLMSRRKAKENIKLEDFEKVMEDAGVWTSCVKQSTLDESPMAYKDAEEIIKYLEPTVEIIAKLKSIYNFKADE